MRRRDSSGPSHGRRGSSGQGRSSGKPVARKSGPAPRSGDDSSDRKKKFQRSSSATPFRKADKRKSGDDARPDKPYGKPSFGSDRKKKFSKSGDSKFSGKPERSEKKEFRKSGSFSDGPSRFVKGKPKRYSPKKEEAPTIANQTGKIRLNRYIANSGVCSRREADEFIKMGLVSVNGNVITEMGFLVNPGDEVRYENRIMRAEKPVYILMNKPKGYITTTKDPQERNTVMHILGNAVKERVYPVGRLDRNTTGLLLFTNDGALADKLSHPSYNVKKIYKVELNRALTKADFQKIMEGVRLEEGRAMVDDLAIVSDDGKTVGIELHIGWNRVVRRIFEKLEYEVVKLDRSVYAGLDKKDLPRGHWRFLTKEEVVRLKHYK